MRKHRKYDNTANRDQSYQFMAAIRAWLEGHTINYDDVNKLRAAIDHRDLRFWAGSLGISAWFLVGEFKMARSQFEKAAILASLDVISKQWRTWKCLDLRGLLKPIPPKSTVHRENEIPVDFKKMAAGDYD